MDLTWLNFEAPIGWLLIVIVCLIIEALTMGLTTIWYAIGGFFALILALLDVPLLWQIIAFIISSTIFLIFTRKIFVDKLKTGQEKTNANALVGKTCVLTSPITYGQMGQTKLNGQEWSAVSEDGKEILAGERVIVKDIEGIKLIVAPVYQGLMEEKDV